MGLFSFVGGLFGAGSQKKASQQATNAIVSALDRGIASQDAFNQQTRADYLPYTQAGTGAVTQLGNFAGLNGADAQGAAYAGLEQNPIYKSLFTNGRDTLLANASATGGLRGGDTAGALAELSPDVLSQVYQIVGGQLGGIANMGLGAQGNVTGVGQGVTNATTGLMAEQGQARANNYLARGRINAQSWQNAGSFLDSAISAGMPGAGGGGFSLGNALKSIF